MANLKDIKFGIEIELVLSRQAAVHAVHRVVGGRSDGQREAGNGWKVVFDGSVAHGCEVVSPPLTYSDMPILQEVVRSLRQAGGRVDSSCGIHVHTDGSAFGAKQVRNLVRTVHKYEPLLWKALGVTDHRRCRWARDVSSDLLRRLERMPGDATLESLARRWYGSNGADQYSRRLTISGRQAQHYDQSRYHGLNLHALWYHGTIEFRYFDSTLHAGKVRAYVVFCVGLAAYALRMKASSSRRRSVEAMGPGCSWYWLLWYQLGLKGDEFKNVRKHLTANFSPEEMRRRDRRRTSPPEAADGPASGIDVQF